VKRGEDTGFDIFAWVGKHKENALPLTESVISALKEKGITAFGATGYCFGGSFD
jgi:dienelactone hydrolase